MADEPIMFATVEDYRTRYPSDETISNDRITAALIDASDMISLRVADTTQVKAATLKRFTCLAASRSLKAQDSEMDGFSSVQRTAGPYSVMVTASNKAGGAYLLDDEWEQLGVGVAHIGFMSMYPQSERCL